MFLKTLPQERQQQNTGQSTHRRENPFLGVFAKNVCKKPEIPTVKFPL